MLWLLLCSVRTSDLPAVKKCNDFHVFKCVTIFTCTPWLRPDAVDDMHSLLPQWSPLRDVLLLLLLLDDVTDIAVRCWATLCISALPLTRLLLLLPPLISTLRHELVCAAVTLTQ